jgi:uncharacterized protein YbjT (DUF2867 family)
MILVTGPTGTVGSEVVRQLQAAGAKFRAAYHSTEKAEAARGAGIDAVAIDLDRPETLAPAMTGVERLFLLSRGARNQFEQEVNALEAAKKAGVKHIVKLSVWGAAEEEFGFARVHRQVEKAIEESGIAFTLLRPCDFMQNMEKYSRRTIQAHGTFFSATGDARVALVDVRDIAAVAVAALTEPGHERKAYSLTGPRAMTNDEIADQISSAAGRKIRYVDLSDADFRQGLLRAGMPEPFADMHIDLMRYYRSGKAATVTGDIRHVTGREATPFEQYARDRVAAFQ